MRDTFQLFVGVDVAATTFTATWTTQLPMRITPVTLPQTPAGFTALRQRLATIGIRPATTLVALEATGSYWVSLAVTLHAAGYVVSVVHPGHVANYAKSLARRAKTDLSRVGQLLVRM